MSQRKTRTEWIEAALVALGERGVDGVRVERLARALGVTKGSFYWHFRDRGDLLGAVLDYWEENGTEEIIERVEQSGGDTGARFQRLWALTAGDRDLGPELAIRDWARRDADVSQRVRRVDNRRMDFVRRLFIELGCPPADAEARSMLAYSLLIGNYFIAAKHGRRKRKTVLADCLALLIDGAGESA